jgi:hypothetical protein
MQGKSDQDFYFDGLHWLMIMAIRIPFGGVKCYWLHLRRDSSTN